MIPKVIHYIWFGGNPLPEDAKRCIESWKKYCPDYEIKEWNESNFDINTCEYIREAYAAKKWAFVSDYVRLAVLVKYGGIYMDTDVEVVDSLDDFLKLKAFSGFETEKTVPTGIMACEMNHPFFARLLKEYDDIHFTDEKGNYDYTTNVTRITKACTDNGLILNNKRQEIEGFTLFPNDYFCPLSHDTGELKRTANTHTIHWFAGSWKSDVERKAHKEAIKIREILPGAAGRLLANFYEVAIKVIDTTHRDGLSGLKKRITLFMNKRR